MKSKREEGKVTPSNASGRLAEVNALFADTCTEKAWAQYRVLVLVEWLEFFVEKKCIKINYDKLHQDLKEINKLNEKDWKWIEEEESKIGHDVKAAVNFVKTRLIELGYPQLAEFVRLGMSSSDVNSLKDALMLREMEETLLLQYRQLIEVLSSKWSDIACPAYTMGSPKGSICFGDILENYIQKISQVYKQIREVPAKVNGTEGSYAILKVIFPEESSRELEEEFVDRLGLNVCQFSEQTCNYYEVGDLLSKMEWINFILIKMANDLNDYVKMGFLVINSAREVRAGITSPNNSKLDNAVSHLRYANAMIVTSKELLATYSLQGDMKSSTVMRMNGELFTYIVNAIRQLCSFLNEVVLNEKKMEGACNYSGLIEAVYAVASMDGIELPSDDYEKYYENGKMNQARYKKWIASLPILEGRKKQLRELTPLCVI